MPVRVQKEGREEHARNWKKGEPGYAKTELSATLTAAVCGK